MTILHAVDTYTTGNDEDSYLVELIEISLILFFIFDYSINLYISENRLLFVFSTNSFNEFISIIPILIMRVGLSNNS